jgi:hypothetical protein
MKYYIEGILPRFDKIEQFYKKTETTKMIYSTEGIFSVETNNIFKMNPIDKPIKKITNYKKGVTIIIDESYFEKQLVYSQIPFDHIFLEQSFKYYCLGNIDGIIFDIYLVFEEHNPVNFYFLTNEQINKDNFIKLLNLI